MVICYIAQSFDGFIATPEGGLDWLPAPKNGVDFGYSEFYRSVDAVLMGRKTFDVCMGMGDWPYSDKPTRVFTHKLTTPVDKLPLNVQHYSQSPQDCLNALYAQGYQNIWLVGGSQLLASFRQAGLVDRYIITTVPVILGRGIPLFAPLPQREFYCCTSAKHYPEGISQGTYNRVIPETSE